MLAVDVWVLVYAKVRETLAEQECVGEPVPELQVCVTAEGVLDREQDVPVCESVGKDRVVL